MRRGEWTLVGLVLTIVWLIGSVAAQTDQTGDSPSVWTLVPDEEPELPSGLPGLCTHSPNKVCCSLRF